MHDPYDTTGLSAILEQSSKAGGEIAYTTMDGKNVTWDTLLHNTSQREDVTAKRSRYTAMPDWEEHSGGISNLSGYEGSDYQIAVELQMVNVPYTWEDAEYMGTDPMVFESVSKKRQYLEEKYGVTLTPYNDAEVLADIQRRSEGEYGSHERFKYLEEMTQDEKEVLYYLFNTQSRGTAMEWYKQYEDIYQERYNQTVKISAAMLGKEMPVFGSAASLATNLLAPAEYAADIVDYATGGEKPYNTMSNISSGVRDSVAENHIDWEIGDYQVGDMLYNAGMEETDSKIASGLFGKGGSVLLGMSAAAQATNDALDRGMSQKQAFWSGLMAGVFDTLFEKWSVKNFRGLKKVASAYAKDIALNKAGTMLGKADGAVRTEVSNIAYDYIINGDFSQYETKVRQYVLSGMTEEEAKKKAAIELGRQVAEKAIGGAVFE